MIQTASYTDVGGRPANEDTVRLSTREGGRLCALVADGLGGHGGGAQASAAAAEVICSAWDGRADPAALTEWTRQANRKVLSLQTRQCAMKTTLVLLALEPGKAAWAHVGDSRLYHFVDGRLAFQTRDHSVAQIGVMLGEITLDEIRFHEDRSRVLRALGQDEDLNVEAAEQPLAPGRHAFLLCSDGFWEYVLEPEMEATLARASDPEDWIARMRVYLKDRIPADNDNNTAAAVWVDGE